MLDSHTETLQGKRTIDGGCSFPMPALTLAPEEDIVGVQQISANYNDCSTVVEFGIPTGVSAAPATRTDSSDPQQLGVTSVEPEDVAIAAAYPTRRTTGYYEVEWEDVFELDVNWVQSWLTWDHNGTKTQSASGQGVFYWRNETGWSKVSSSWSITPYQPQVRWVISDAHFKNTAFCSYVVHNYYDDVTVGGWYDGRLQGRLSSTSTNAGGYGCPPLHWSARLVRVSG